MVEQTDVIYREVQYSRQWWLVLIVVGASIVTIAVFGYGMVQQLIFGRQWGSNPTSNGALLIVGSLAILFWIALDWLFLSSHLTTEVRSDGLHIRYFPFHLSWRKISLDDVKTIQAVTYSPLGEYGGWGIRGFSRNRAYNPTGNRGARMEYADGRRLLIGSGRPDELARAIGSVMTKAGS